MTFLLILFTVAAIIGLLIGGWAFYSGLREAEIIGLFIGAVFGLPSLVWLISMAIYWLMG